MNKRIYIVVAIILAALLGGYFFFLSSVEPVIEEEPQEEVVVEEPEEEEPVIERLENENLLTGLPTLTDEAVGLRPVAVMVSNVRASMPQYGIGSADVIVELPIESGATRLMAMFGDMTQIPMIAPTRSARPIFPVMAQGFDIFYAHWGNDPYITHFLYEILGSDRFDGAVNTGGLFGRDQNRLNAGFPLEHTAYFDGTRFKEAAENLGLRLELAENHQPTFNFHPFGEVAVPTGESAETIHIDFRGTTADFTFNAETGLYEKDFNGTPHMDDATGGQLAFTNLFVLESTVFGNAIGHMEFDLSGNGFYISNGIAQPIAWEQQDGLRFFDESGKEILVNRGNSYIAVTHNGGVTFE
ncbi:MAG: DUF3048 domain-containing protein [Turicibacter sp.]|nr:DUF3048 domain-containing protein [Turicibacter sp.]